MRRGFSWILLSSRKSRPSQFRPPPPTDDYKQFMCQQLVPYKVLNQDLLMHTNTQKLTRGWKLNLWGVMQFPVCNRTRLRIEGHCKSEWSERQRPLGKAVLITRYDYSKGNVCVWVCGGEFCVGVLADWFVGECVSGCSWLQTSEHEIFSVCVKCAKKKKMLLYIPK